MSAPKVDPDQAPRRLTRLSAADRADLREIIDILAEALGTPGPFVPRTGRLCSTCRRVLPRAGFTRDRYTRDGLSYVCRACRKASRARTAERRRL